MGKKSKSTGKKHNKEIKCFSLDESGEMQQKNVETQIGSDGNIYKENNLELPENPKGPEGWDTTGDENVRKDGWVKRQTEGGSGEGETFNPETDLPEEGYDYLPKFIKTITVTRYIYNNQKLAPDKTGEVVALGKEIVTKASIELETDTTNKKIEEYDVTPFKWVT